MSSKTERILRYTWSIISWIVLTGLVTGIGASLYYYQRAEDEVRHLVEVRLAEIYPQLTFRIKSARILSGEGIRLGRISVVGGGGEGTAERLEMAYAESLTLHCDASLPALLQRKIVVSHIVCDGLRLNGHRDARGRWNLAQLIPAKPPPILADRLPRITIQRASLQLHDDRDAESRVLQVEDIDLRVRLKRLGTRPSVGERPRIPKVLVALEGSLRTAFCQRIDIEGVARTTDGAWTLRGDAAGISWSPEMVQRAPSFLAGPLQKLTSVHGRGDANFRVGQASHGQPMDYQVNGHVAEAHWQDARWPQSISNISCDFVIDPAGCQVLELIASYGMARVGGHFSLTGHDLSHPYDLTLTLDRFPLTRSFVGSLPASLQAKWQEFRAEGALSGELRVQFDGSQYRYESELALQDFSFQHFKFPYPITQCQGRMNLSSDMCRFEIGGSAGGTPIELSGVIQHPGPRSTGWWEAKTTRWKAIDEALLTALPDGVEPMIRRMQLRGNIGFKMRHQRDVPGARVPPDMTIELDRAWINYDGFPYPISNIQGSLESHGGRWTFTNLEGWNDNCRVLCSGYWDTADSSKPLELHFQLNNLGLDNELKHALRPGAQQIWTQLRPQGRLDRVDVDLFKTVDLLRPELDIRIVHGNRPGDQKTSDGLQLQPTWLPLRLSNVEGEARMRGSSLTLRKITGQHGKLQFRTNGSGEFRPNGSWTMLLTDLAVDRLEITDSTLQALPSNWSQAMSQLGLGGSYSVAGSVRLGREERSAPVASSWELMVNIEQGRIGGSVPMAGVFGQIQVSGERRGRQFSSRGRLQLDSIVSHGVQLTGITGPFLLDSTRIVLGKGVRTDAVSTNSQPITASVYQGKASVNAEILLNLDRDFSVQVNVTSANLKTLSRDWQLGQGSLAGKAYLELFLTGNKRGRQTLRGTGTGQLRDANLYELPLILALLSRMGSGRTDNTAFTTSDIAFHVSDGYIYFDRFDLAGDAITLKGKGEMSLERRLNLDFYSIMGREQRWSPIVRPFLGEASRQFLLIHVDGPIGNPQTTQEVLPGVNETLQRLFPELSGASARVPQADNRSGRTPTGLFPRRH